ncbi:hypothetical protein [Metabacillus niabensis]|uniref:hypothetical protein n=1 Tax=Metabacillus niabensis TaxID=324854 RepID=UPI001CF9412E|nr:hypothetical protein [Metabacillus niabensis]
MKDELINSYKYMKKLIKHYSNSQHPNDLYISSLLMELVSLTRSTIMILQQKVVAKRRLRHALTVLFRSYVAFKNAFNEWVKNANLNEPAKKQVIFQREVLANYIEKHVIVAIQGIEETTGNELSRR